VEFGSATTLTVPGPVADVGATASQGVPVDAVQGQATLFGVTVTVDEPPEPDTKRSVGETVNVHVIPAA
jgi:hypothetical protein